MSDIILLSATNITSEGLTLKTNKPCRLKGNKGIETDEWWVSWDKIGENLIEGYTERKSVEELNKLRIGENK